MYTERINLPRYTYDAWMKCYPESDMEEWEMANCPNCITDFAIGESVRYQELTAMDLSNWEIRVVAIDDEYFNWINKNKFENTEEMRAMYVRSITDAKANELLVKNKMNIDDQLLFLHFLITGEKDFGPSTNYSLSKECVKELREYLKSIYRDSKVYAPPYIMTAERAEMSAEQLLDSAKQFFEEGKIKHNKKYNMQHYSEPDCNITQLYIPCVIRNEYDDSVFNIGELLLPKTCEKNLKYYPNKIFYDRRMLDFYRKYNIKPILETKFIKLLIEIFEGYDVSFYPAPAIKEEVSILEDALFEVFNQNDFELLDNDYPDDEDFDDYLEYD